MALIQTGTHNPMITLSESFTTRHTQKWKKPAVKFGRGGGLVNSETGYLGLTNKPARVKSLPRVWRLSSRLYRAERQSF
ncbi:hypothetical protein J6590_070440 [Homalodisca vitripennis]|nr:hypothetical protein J6590_070440 [Homalodisca vitripennis]